MTSFSSRIRVGATVRVLAPAALVVALGVGASRFVGFGKELLVANQLGAGIDLDAFLMAYLFPAFVFGAFSGAIQAATVPEFLACKTREGDAQARRMFAEAGLAISVFLAMVAALMLLVAFAVLPSLASGFTEPALEQVKRLLPWLMPLLVLTCLNSYWAGILNAEGRFTLAAFAPTITPLCVVLVLLGMPHFDGSVRLAIGTMVGALIELGLMAVALRALGFGLVRRGFLRSWRWRRMVGQFAAMAVASTLMALTMFVDQAFAARLQEGSVSVLSFGTKLGGVASSMLVVVVSTLALPAMARLAAEERWQSMESSFFRVCAVLLAGTLLIAFVLAVASRPIVDVLYRHGEFSAAAAEEAARVQFLHAWHIPFYVLGTMALRVLVALRLSRVAVVGSAVNLAINVATNTIAAPALGVAGVALATTTMYAASCVFLSIVAVIELRRRQVGVADPD